MTAEEMTIKKIGGIGLTNVKKRLELGYAPQDYELIINQNQTRLYSKTKIKSMRLKSIIIDDEPLAVSISRKVYLKKLKKLNSWLLSTMP